MCLSAQTTKSRGVPAYPYFQNLEQPDGTTVKLKMCGDRVLNWLETEDGVKVLRNKEGWFTYATTDSRAFMVPSSRIVGKAATGVGAQKVSGQKKIFFNAKQIENRERAYFGDKVYSQMRVQGRNSFVMQKASFPSTGVAKKSIMILAEFSDVPHKVDAAEFYKIMNEANYNKTGSFRDFYLENSYGQFDCTTDIVQDGDNTYVWVTLPNTMKYYGENGGTYDQDLRPGEMIADACKAAEKVGVDFSQYDNDKDGEVDNVMVIHSGFGEEAGASSDAIWSHRHKLYSDAIFLDGVKIYNYITFPELSGSYGENPTNIGVLVHEFGHALGLPDYYDADYEGSGGHAYGLGKWDVMSGGSWNNNGVTPAQHNAYSKYFLNWIDLPVLNDSKNPSSGEIELKDISSNKEGGAYMIKSKLDGEFFVIENRQQTNFNSAIPSHGMLVYHIDMNYKTKSRNGNYYSSWDMNTMNNDPSHQAMEILFAGKSTYSSTIPFPGSRNVNVLSDFTGENYSVVSVKKSHDPTLVNWNLSRSESSLTNIREEAGVVKFLYSPDQKVNVNVSILYKFDGIEKSDVDFSDYKLKLVNSSTNKEFIVDLDKDGNVAINDFSLGSYDITLIGDNKLVTYNGKTYDVSFVKEYNNVSFSSNNVQLELKANRDLSVSFKYKGEVIDIDYTGFALEFTREGLETKRVFLDSKGKCSLNIIDGGVYSVSLLSSTRYINVNGNNYTVSFKQLYSNVEVYSSAITLDLKEDTEIGVVYKFDEILTSNVDYSGDKLILKKSDNPLFEKSFVLDAEGKANFDGVDAGIYDVFIESDEKSIDVDGKTYSVVFVDKYKNININASKIILELKQRFIIKVAYKYDGENSSLIDYSGDILTLGDISISLNSDGIGVIEGINLREYDVNASVSSKELYVDGRKAILTFNKLYKMNFKETSSYIDLDLKLLKIGDDEEIKIFPNPTSGYAQIEASFNEGTIIRVYDMAGLLVIDKILSGSDMQNNTLHGLDLSALNAGIYNVLIIDGSHKITKRIIKQ